MAQAHSVASYFNDLTEAPTRNNGREFLESLKSKFESKRMDMSKCMD